jgi:hypothetical protein
MSLAIPANGLYALSKSLTVDLMVAALALTLPHWQWHCLTDFVIKICLSSLAAIKLVVLCTAQP